jgi:hypothetical protein
MAGEITSVISLITWLRDIKVVVLLLLKARMASLWVQTQMNIKIT